MRNYMLKFRWVAFLCFLFSAQGSMAQFKLTAETHGLKSGDVHITRNVDYTDAGDAGENVVWDFSKLTCGENKVNYIGEADDLAAENRITNANVTVTDDNSTFFYNVSQAGIDYVGLTTSRSVVVFDEPLSRMKYPFAYGDSYEKEFKGKGFYNATNETYVTGNISVTADGYGTILLPNGIVENVLRVKAVSRTLEVTLCTFEETLTTKYLWYAQNERYPVLVLMHTIENSPENGSVEKNTAHYSDKIFSSKAKSLTSDVQNYLNIEHSYTLFPNPFAEEIAVNIELADKSKVKIDVFDANGKYIKNIANDTYRAGTVQKFMLNGNSLKLSQGIYFVRLELGEKTYLERIVFTP